MDEFFIPSATGHGGLLFYERSPRDPAKPFDGFWVRVTDHNLSAAALVHAGYAPSHPASFVADMARKGPVGRVNGLAVNRRRTYPTVQPRPSGACFHSS